MALGAGFCAVWVDVRSAVRCGDVRYCVVCGKVLLSAVKCEDVRCAR